ncbi:MAG TPA: response regulator transcription factor [Candidatus Limnocylindrales bacterium]|nr:response regulator transcription factor [Candidatus Limnocylindrales bacterium]
MLLVDDQPLFRRALATLISAQFDMTVVGEGENGRDALDKVRALQPDLVVMDVNMPGASGVDGVNAIRAAGFTMPIVMLTVSEDDDDLFESIKAGANGYLLKNVRPEQLFEDLRGVMHGEAPIAPAVASKLLDALRTGGLPTRGARSAAAAPQDSVLTRREAEILQLVAAGMSNKEIASELTITEGTVKNHVHNSLEKLHLTNRVQAAAYAVRQGYATQEPPQG